MSRPLSRPAPRVLPGAPRLASFLVAAVIGGLVILITLDPELPKTYHLISDPSISFGAFSASAVQLNQNATHFTSVSVAATPRPSQPVPTTSLVSGVPQTSSVAWQTSTLAVTGDVQEVSGSVCLTTALRQLPKSTQSCRQFAFPQTIPGQLAVYSIAEFRPLPRWKQSSIGRSLLGSVWDSTQLRDSPAVGLTTYFSKNSVFGVTSRDSKETTISAAVVEPGVTWRSPALTPFSAFFLFLTRCACLGFLGFFVADLLATQWGRRGPKATALSAR